MKGRRHVRGVKGGATAATAGVSVLSDHVRVNLESDAPEAWRDCADVLYDTGEPAIAVGMLETYPGCLLASVRDRGDGRCTVVARGGVRIEVDRVRDEREHALVASALYRLLLALSRDPRPVTVPPAAGHLSD